MTAIDIVFRTLILHKVTAQQTEHNQHIQHFGCGYVTQNLMQEKSAELLHDRYLLIDAACQSYLGFNNGFGPHVIFMTNASRANCGKFIGTLPRLEDRSSTCSSICVEHNRNRNPDYIQFTDLCKISGLKTMPMVVTSTSRPPLASFEHENHTRAAGNPHLKHIQR